MNKTPLSLVTRTLHTSSPLQIREGGEGETGRTITGYAILFDTPSAVLYADEHEECRETIAPEAVSRALLDSSDIKMTMFHDMQLILARSRQGSGTLSYTVDDRGVAFSFDAPNTVDGDKALELVRRGDISGCSFMFSTMYRDPEYVEKSETVNGGKCEVTFRIKKIIGIYDFTLTPDPAYPDTSCESRDLFRTLTGSLERDKRDENAAKMQQQWHEMQRAANTPISNPNPFLL